MMNRHRKLKGLFCVLVSLLCLLTSGCYRPVYGVKDFSGASSPAEARLNMVAIGNIPDQQGQMLRNMLIDRFYTKGRPARPDYALSVSLLVAEDKLGIQKDATALRARVEITATYELVDTRTRKKLFSGFNRAIANYSFLAQQYATLAAKDDAYRRSLKEIADLITTRVLLELDAAAREPE